MMQNKEPNPEFIRIDNVEFHDAKYFAMLNDAVAVSGDKRLEGGQTKKSLSYYYYLLNIKIPNCPLTLQLTEKQQTRLQKSFKDLIAVNDLLEKSFANGSLYTPEGINKVISTIEKNSDETGVCYLPSGYSGNPGHFAGLKIRKLENGKYALSVINHGEGMQYHQELSLSGTKRKRSYQSDEYEIDFHNESGREFLQKMLELQFDKQRIYDTKEVVNAYSSDDLYGLLKLYGKKIPLTDKLSEKSVTSQRSGTCTVTNVHGIAKDILIDNDADFNTRKRYHFVLKLRSIIAGFDAYLKGQYPRNVLEWALTEFSVRINKQYNNILTDEEIIYCSELERKIRDRLLTDSENELQKKCEKKDFPNTIGEVPKNLERFLTQKNIEIVQEEKAEPKEEKINVVSTKFIKPEDVKKLLEFERYDEARNEIPFPYKRMYEILNSLPHCSGFEKDPFWDRLSQSDVDRIISQLYKIVEQLNSSTSINSLDRGRAFAMALIAYDIVAQLAPRFAPTFYGNFKSFQLGNKYALGLDDVYSEHYFYTDPIDYYTVKRIARNFERRGQNKERILTNTVNYDNNSYDSTINYIIRVILTEPQRKAVAQARMKEENKDSANYSDEELFEYLTTHLDMTYEPSGLTETILNMNIRFLIGISATAHALGNFTKSYNKNDKHGIYYFLENRFHQEVKRQAEFKNTAIASHIPQAEYNLEETNYNDFSENTLYHPIDDLEKQQNEFRKNTYHGNEYGPKVKLQPYQLYLSGSLNPESAIWEPLDNQKHIYEELNEDLRHIECSPNLQVIRTLAFASANTNKLIYKEIRDRVHELLFQYGKLDIAFVNQLDVTLENLNDLLMNLLKQLYEDVPPKPELVQMLWRPNTNNLNDIPSKSGEGYIVYGASLFYFNKINKTCIEIEASIDAIEKITEMKPTRESRCLSADEQKTITQLTGHSIPYNNELLFWSANLANDLRYHLEVATKLYKLPTNKLKLPCFQDILLTRLKNTVDANERSHLASLVVCGFRNRFPFSVKDCCTLLICRIIANLGDASNLSDETWEKIFPEVMTSLGKDKNKILKNLQEILPSYITFDSIKEWNLEGTKINWIGTDTYIDLHTGSLKRKNVKNLKDRTEKTIIENKELFEQLNLSPKNIKLVYTNDSSQVMTSFDGNWEFEYHTTITRDARTKFTIFSTKHTFILEGLAIKCKLLSDKKIKDLFKQDNNPFESNETNSVHYQYWESLTNPNLIFVRDQKNQKLAYVIFYDENIALMDIDTVKVFANKAKETDFDLESAKDVLHSLLEQTSNGPILIKDGIKYYLFGFCDNEWKLTELNNKNKIFEGLKFEYGKFSKSKMSMLSKEIQQEINDSKSHTQYECKAIRQVTQKVGEVWQLNNKLLLNLVKPETELEKEWSDRLAPIFGVSNIRCLASLSNDKATYQIDSIENLTLGLSFTVNDKQQLICNEYPEYFLSPEQSLKEIHGLPSIIILENEEGDKKYIIPAFSLHAGEKNNALNFDNIVNYNSLCNKEQVFFNYTLKNNELVGDSVESNLYLAILYRSLGEFEQAIRCLERCKSHKNINAEIFSIASQVLTRQVKSPTGAAFDLKLHCYLREHQQKWSKDIEQNFKPIEISDAWIKFIDEQFDYYNNTFSSFKKDVAIIPSFLRITEKELALLQDNKKEVNKDKKENADPITRSYSDTISKRLLQICKLPTDVIAKGVGWRDHVDIIKRTNKIDFTGLPDKLTNLRLYPGLNDSPTLPYLIKNFGPLFLDAISGDPSRINQMQKTLFFLLQNDADPKSELLEFISLLVFASRPEYKSYFKSYHLPLDTDKFKWDIIIEVGEIFSKYKEELKDKTAYLFEMDLRDNALTVETSLQSDFIFHPAEFLISKMGYEVDCKHPLGKIAEEFFNQKDVPIAKRDFLLEEKDIPNATLLEKRLLKSYHRGHIQNQKKTKAVYSPKKDSLLDLKTKLLKIKARDERRVLKLETALNKANRTPLDDLNANISNKARAHNLLQAWASGQKHKISISDLFTAFLQKNPQLLLEQNPFLNQDDISQLFADLADYALLQSRIEQINQALTLIGEKTSFIELGSDQDSQKLENYQESYQLQQLATNLDKPRVFDIREYPEFLVYEYATGRLLREDQVNILIELIKLIESDSTSDADMHHGLLQFAAGGGKTSVLIPILAHRFAQKGFLPVIFNTSELYQIGLEEIPKNLRASFKQNIEVIERELEHPWTEIELNKLLKDMERWRQEKKCLLLKPVTWHSINITMKLTYFGRNYELAKAAAEVLDFFKEKSVKLEDECHIVSDPMQQSIKTFGHMRKIPDEQLGLLLTSYDLLMGNSENSREIAKLAKIKSDRKRSIPSEKLKELQKQLATILAKDDALKEIPQDQLIEYLLQDDKKKPDWLNDLYYRRWRHNDKTLQERDEKLANLIVLSRAFIKTHLPHILSLQYQKDYGASIHKGDLTVAPKHEGKDVTSHFGDHTLVAALTIQLYQKRGLLPSQVDQLLDHINKEYQEERKWNKDLRVPTEIEKWLLPLIPSKYKVESLHNFKQNLKSTLSADPDFCKNPEIINKYLNEFALQQIKVPSERQVSTAADLQAGFRRSLLLSATPSLPEIYPAFLKPEHCFLEEAFEAQVIDTLLDIQNKGFCILKKNQTPEEFFNQFSPELLSKMTTLIDRGSLLTQFEAKDIIVSYLDLDKEKVATNTAAFFSKQYLHLKTKNPLIKEKDIPGAGLVEELKKQGVEPEKFLLFLFLDLSKTTGTDIKRPFKDHAGLTVGKEQTVTETIQAAMRERQLLDDNAQTITWLMFQSLYREIHPDAPPNTFDARKIFYWMIKNEAKEIESKLINRAYQGIYQAISEVAWMGTRKNPEKFHNYSEGFLLALQESQDIAPFLIYEIDSTIGKTEFVLRDYVRKLHSNFKFHEKGIRLPKEPVERVEKIIRETSDLIANLQNPPKTQLGNEVQQEMQTEFTQQQEQEQEQEQRIKNKNDSATDFIYEKERYTVNEDNLDSIFNKQLQSIKKRYQVVSLPNCDFIKQPELILCPQHFAVTQGSNLSGSPLSQLKPIKMLLVKIMPDNKMEYIACTAKGADFYSSMINNCFLKQKEPAYAIITTEGKIIHKSNNITLDKCRYLAQSNECKRMQTYTNFLNGKVSNPILLSEIIKDYLWTKENYDRMVNSIGEIHISKTPVNLKNKVISKLCGWDTKKIKNKNLKVPSQYKTPIEVELNFLENKPLHTITELDNHLEESDLPIMYPGSALEGYVIGQKPQPMEKKHKNLATLISTHQKIKSIKNINHIVGKDEAVKTLNEMTINIINSVRSQDEKIKAVQSLYDDFNQLDRFLEKVHQRLRKFSGKDYLNTLKNAGMHAITQAYTSFSEGLSVDNCEDNLKIALFAISEETESQYKMINHKRYSPAVIVDFASKRSLESILNEAALALDSNAINSYR